MRKLFSLLITISMALTMLSCVVSSYPEIPPPPPKRVIVRARPGYVWVPGHWVWRGGRYVWVPGHWKKARRGYVWIPGHWERRGNHWVWIKGRWVRR